MVSSYASIYCTSLQPVISHVALVIGKVWPKNNN